MLEAPRHARSFHTAVSLCTLVCGTSVMSVAHRCRAQCSTRLCCVDCTLDCYPKHVDLLNPLCPPPFLPRLHACFASLCGVGAFFCSRVCRCTYTGMVLYAPPPTPNGACARTTTPMPYQHASIHSERERRRMKVSFYA
ncbi:hypothetical protein, conserved [Leishmania donovani]|uniref:Secreted protein n=1 Tax=Leishmania donovani TaxID=5661 RepID=E9BGB1_LEIDO|nr:hypothetical protein, conserved [Leishmania donovani]CBZ34287.1 hypothetical protein, conserved [Leishmania donovani]